MVRIGRLGLGSIRERKGYKLKFLGRLNPKILKEEIDEDIIRMRKKK